MRARDTYEGVDVGLETRFSAISTPGLEGRDVFLLSQSEVWKPQAVPSPDFGLLH